MQNYSKKNKHCFLFWLHPVAICFGAVALWVNIWASNWKGWIRQETSFTGIFSRLRCFWEHKHRERSSIAERLKISDMQMRAVLPCSESRLSSFNTKWDSMLYLYLITSAVGLGLLAACITASVTVCEASGKTHFNSYSDYVCWDIMMLISQPRKHASALTSLKEKKEKNLIINFLFCF